MSRGLEAVLIVGASFAIFMAMWVVLFRWRPLLRVAIAPVALPILGAVVLWQRWTREWPQGRRSTWYWRLWWFYGYHGLYQIDWWLRRRKAAP